MESQIVISKFHIQVQKSALSFFRKKHDFCEKPQFSRKQSLLLFFFSTQLGRILLYNLKFQHFSHLYNLITDCQ